MNELLEQQKQMENSTFRVVKRKLECEYENSPFGNSQTQMICNQKKSNLNHHFVGGNGIVCRLFRLLELPVGRRGCYGRVGPWFESRNHKFIDERTALKLIPVYSAVGVFSPLAVLDFAHHENRHHPKGEPSSGLKRSEAKDLKKMNFHWINTLNCQKSYFIWNWFFIINTYI